MNACFPSHGERDVWLKFAQLSHQNVVLSNAISHAQAIKLDLLFPIQATTSLLFGIPIFCSLVALLGLFFFVLVIGVGFRRIIVSCFAWIPMRRTISVSLPLKLLMLLSIGMSHTIASVHPEGSLFPQKGNCCRVGSCTCRYGRLLKIIASNGRRRKALVLLHQKNGDKDKKDGEGSSRCHGQDTVVLG